MIQRRLEDDRRRVTIDGVGNIIAIPQSSEPVILVGAHFDTVDDSPGADDNASAVAVLLGLSRSLAEAGRQSVGFIAFNAEEDGIRGSAEWADAWAATRNPPIAEVHVLEMLGYRSHAPASQSVPPGLPRWLKVPSVGDFVGVLGDHRARRIVKRILRTARSGSDVPVVALQTYLGVEKLLPSLDLSDHIRFWERRVPAVLWTDTAFYRNPHYHLDTDTPETLDPDFLSGVAHLIHRVICSNR